MKWEVNGELPVVQGSIERAKDVIQSNEITMRLAEDTKASSLYTFTHEIFGDLGIVKISALRQNKTEVYG